MKRILFICKHNLFRSRVAEIFFNKLNENKEYQSSSAGIIRYYKRDLKNDSGYEAEKNIARRLFNIKLKVKSKSITSKILRKTNILIIVADDVPVEIFETEKSFSGKIIVWKIPDVKKKDKNKEIVARNTIKFIEKKIKDLVNNL
ncbi:hypothetical protein FJZ21_01720 [Candidatus Pacearchaeota archaeon]|nr:hypothetical protein [Candidatus Pacearchaeota archaeon]